MSGDHDDARRAGAPAWHERTPTLVGASAAALVVLAMVYFIISTVAREVTEPAPAPQQFLDPGSSSSASRTESSTPTTTTQTITSTRAPITSDINNPGDTTTTGTSTSGTDTSSSASVPRTPPHTHEPGSTRSRPRLNQTRTLYPAP